MVYNTELMRHAQCSSHRGKLENPDFSVVLSNPTCGDTLHMYGNICSGGFSALKFEAAGCLLSQAAASLLIEKMLGERVDTVLKLTPEDLLMLIPARLGLSRQKCIILSLDALKEGVATYARTHHDA